MKQYNIVSRLMEEARSAFIDQYGPYESIPEDELVNTMSMFALSFIVRIQMSNKGTKSIHNAVSLLIFSTHLKKVREFINKYIDFQAEESDVTELKPFQRVLTRDGDNDIWHINIFEHYSPLRPGYRCIRNSWFQCVPYNEETRHLLLTRKPAPEKYQNDSSQRQENNETD